MAEKPRPQEDQPKPAEPVNPEPAQEDSKEQLKRTVKDFQKKSGFDYEQELNVDENGTERGWKVSHFNPKDGTVTLYRETEEKDANGFSLEPPKKIVPLDKLIEWNKPEPKQEQKKEPEPQIVPEPTLKSGEPQPGREPILKTEEDKMQVEEELLGAFTELVGRTKYREKGAVSVDDKGRANVLYGQVAGLYKSLAGENFFGKVNDQARQELQAKGYKIMTRKEYLSQSHEDALRQKMQKEGWAEGVKAIWDQLSPEDKAKGSIESFASELENDRKDLAGRGFVFSKDVYYGLFKAGYDPRTVEEKGFLKDIFKKNTRIEIERLDEKKETFTLDQFEAKRQALQQDFNQNVDKQVSDRLAKGYAEGRDRWVKTRLKKAGDAVLDVTKEYQNKEVGEGAAKFFEKKVRPENITPEQEMKLEEEEAEKTYHDRFNVLMNIMKIRVVDRLGLTDKQEEALRAHIDSGKKLPKNFLYLKV